MDYLQRTKLRREQFLYVTIPENRAGQRPSSLRGLPRRACRVPGEPLQGQ